MPKETLIIVGAGGVGKSPLDRLLRQDVARIDPYRLREKGPRDTADRLYAPPGLRSSFSSALERLGDVATPISVAGTDEEVEWFPKARVLFFTVRGEWQCLILAGLEGNRAKAELYAPILPSLLAIPEVCGVLGQLLIVVLNPASHSIAEMPDWSELQAKTRCNCKRRGDTQESIQKRVASVPQEAPAWKELIEKHGATEFVDWPFPEYRYGTPPDRDLLLEAQQCLVRANCRLEAFFQSP